MERNAPHVAGAQTCCYCSKSSLVILKAKPLFSTGLASQDSTMLILVSKADLYFFGLIYKGRHKIPAAKAAVTISHGLPLWLSSVGSRDSRP